MADGFLVGQGQRIAELASRYMLPSIGEYREYVQRGGLMSYGPSFANSYRRAAAYVDKILKGARPGDISIEQPTKFELFINLKTARAIGVRIPDNLLALADAVRDRRRGDRIGVACLWTVLLGYTRASQGHETEILSYLT